MKDIKLEPLSDEWVNAIYTTNTGSVRAYFYPFDSEQAVAVWVADALTHVPEGKHEYVIRDVRSGEFIGMISPRILDDGIADIGMWIKESAQGKGYGKAALSLMIEMLLSCPEVMRIDYHTDRGNIPSVKLATSVGMRVIKEDSEGIHFVYLRC